MHHAGALISCPQAFQYHKYVIPEGTNLKVAVGLGNSGSHVHAVVIIRREARYNEDWGRGLKVERSAVGLAQITKRVWNASLSRTGK